MADLPLPTESRSVEELTAIAAAGSELLGEILLEAALGISCVEPFDAEAFLAATDAPWGDADLP